MTTSQTHGVEKTQECLRTLLHDFASSGNKQEELRKILFGGGGPEGEDRKGLEWVAGAMVTALCLAVATLRDRVVKKTTPFVS